MVCAPAKIKSLGQLLGMDRKTKETITFSSPFLEQDIIGDHDRQEHNRRHSNGYSIGQFLWVGKKSTTDPSLNAGIQLFD